jgi:multisubunit Na+/H+ antiporter MnhG subunit
MIIVLGIAIVIFGVILYFGGKLGIGRLPGDIYVKKGNFTFYFPVVTCIIASIIMTIIFSLIRR